MQLTLRVTRAPAGLAVAPRMLTGGALSIGRGEQNNWVLPDAQQHISKQHCVVVLRDGQWVVQDHSTFGTFLNADIQPVGRGRSRALRDGDRLRLGLYELDVRINADATIIRSDTESIVHAGRDAPGAEMLADDPFLDRSVPRATQARPSPASADLASVGVVRAFLHGNGVPAIDPAIDLATLGSVVAAGIAAGLNAMLDSIAPTAMGPHADATAGATNEEKARAWDRYVESHSALKAEVRDNRTGLFATAFNQAVLHGLRAGSLGSPGGHRRP